MRALQFRQRLGLTAANPMRVISFLGLGWIVAGIAGVLALVLGAPPLPLVIFPGTVLICGVVSLGFGAAMGRTYGDDIRRMRAGDAWLHWHLDAAEARRLGLDAIGGAQSLGWKLLLVSLGVGALLGVLTAWAGFSVWWIPVSVATVGCGGAFALAAQLWPDRRRGDAADGRGFDLYVSADGIYDGHHYTPLNGINLRPVGAKVTSGPLPELVLRTESRSGEGLPLYNDVLVPIPPGREADAAALAAKFAAAYGWDGTAGVSNEHAAAPAR